MRLIDADELIYLECDGVSFVPKDFIDDAQTIEERKTSDMKLIDGEHLRGWILARWGEIDKKSEYPLKAIDILDQIDREYAYPPNVSRGVVRVKRKRPVGRWIPVSKGLPELEYDGFFEGTDCFSSDTVLVTLADGSVTAAYCSVNKEQDEEFVEWVSVKDKLLNVIAWMPFPEAYKEED